MTYKRCPTCKEHYTEDAVYCHKCGVKLIMRPGGNSCSVPGCCYSPNDGDVYCERCGAKTTYELTRLRDLYEQELWRAERERQETPAKRAKEALNV
jgi:hypothetical protein